MAKAKLKTASLEDLQATQALLQKAHDHVELHGFTIHTYADTHYRGAAIVPVRVGCYIGTLRMMAGVPAIPPTIGEERRGDDRVQNKADHGNGPELSLALKILDDIAKPWLSDESFEAVVGGYKHKRGRYIERLGFQTHAGAPVPTGEETYGGMQAAAALGMLREGLRKVYRAIERHQQTP